MQVVSKDDLVTLRLPEHWRSILPSDPKSQVATKLAMANLDGRLCKVLGVKVDRKDGLKVTALFTPEQIAREIPAAWLNKPAASVPPASPPPSGQAAARGGVSSPIGEEAAAAGAGAGRVVGEPSWWEDDNEHANELEVDVHLANLFGVSNGLGLLHPRGLFAQHCPIGGEEERTKLAGDYGAPPLEGLQEYYLLRAYILIRTAFTFTESRDDLGAACGFPRDRADHD